MTRERQFMIPKQQFTAAKQQLVAADDIKRAGVDRRQHGTG